MSAANCDSGPQPLLPHALRLHRLGVSVIPIKAGTKKPAVPWKQFQGQRACEATLHDWFSDVDNCQLGLGVVLGEVSGGLLVRDFDNSDGYHTLVRASPKLASVLPAVKTSRGHHVWFRCEDYLPAGAKSFIQSYADGELRGDGHIVVVPPTIHPQSSLPYEWLIEPGDSIPVVELQSLAITVRSAHVTQEVSVLHGTSLDEALPTMIEKTVPRGFGQRHGAVFGFARVLKGHPEASRLSPPELEPAVRRWFERAYPNVRTKLYDKTFEDFARGWELVKWPAGAGSLQAALRRAREAPLPVAALRYKTPAKRLLVALCRELQRECGEQPFFLACRDAAEAVGLGGREPHVTVWRWLWEFCEAGILQHIQSGSRVSGKANEYRYLPDDRAGSALG